jgi:DNA-binding MarR family transcriptional regulator
MVEVEQTATRLRKVIRRLNRRGESLTAEGGPTWPQHAVLHWLSERGPLTAKALAQLERVRPQSMARILDVLVERGWVCRMPDAADRRQSLVSLTPEGEAALRRGHDVRQVWLAEAMQSALTDEERRTLVTAVELLERIADA